MNRRLIKKIPVHYLNPKFADKLLFYYLIYDMNIIFFIENQKLLFF